jgi:hypothetical protein
LKIVRIIDIIKIVGKRRLIELQYLLVARIVWSILFVFFFNSSLTYALNQNLAVSRLNFKEVLSQYKLKNNMDFWKSFQDKSCGVVNRLYEKSKMGYDVKKDSDIDTIVVGDVHANIHQFLFPLINEHVIRFIDGQDSWCYLDTRTLEKVDYSVVNKEYLIRIPNIEVILEQRKKKKVVFVGDIINGQNYSAEVFFSFLFLVKNNPEIFTYLLGNHEVSLLQFSLLSFLFREKNKNRLYKNFLKWLVIGIKEGWIDLFYNQNGIGFFHSIVGRGFLKELRKSCDLLEEKEVIDFFLQEKEFLDPRQRELFFISDEYLKNLEDYDEIINSKFKQSLDYLQMEDIDFFDFIKNAYLKALFYLSLNRDDDLSKFLREFVDNVLKYQRDKIILEDRVLEKLDWFRFTGEEEIENFKRLDISFDIQEVEIFFDMKKDEINRKFNRVRDVWLFWRQNWAHPNLNLIMPYGYEEDGDAGIPSFCMQMILGHIPFDNIEDMKNPLIKSKHLRRVRFRNINYKSFSYILGCDGDANDYNGDKISNPSYVKISGKGAVESFSLDDNIRRVFVKGDVDNRIWESIKVELSV